LLTTAGPLHQAESSEGQSNGERWPEKDVQREGSSAAVAESAIAQLPR